MTNRIRPIPLNGGGLQDSLGGMPLIEGETLAIRWPAGSLQIITIRLHSVPMGMALDGEVKTVPCIKAYVEIPTRGTMAKIFLAGFEAQRVR